MTHMYIIPCDARILTVQEENLFPCVVEVSAKGDTLQHLDPSFIHPRPVMDLSPRAICALLTPAYKPLHTPASKPSTLHHVSPFPHSSPHFFGTVTSPPLWLAYVGHMFGFICQA
jgi:hypothetical protein